MRLSTKGQYGIKAILDLRHQKDKNSPVPISDICRRQDIPRQYLEQIMLKLRREGIVHSIRGAHGGYALSKEPSAIGIGDVIRASEGPINLIKCDEESVPCHHAGDCMSREIWQRVSDKIIETLNETSVEELYQDAIRKHSVEGDCFFSRNDPQPQLISIK